MQVGQRKKKPWERRKYLNFTILALSTYLTESNPVNVLSQLPYHQFKKGRRGVQYPKEIEFLLQHDTHRLSDFQLKCRI